MGVRGGPGDTGTQPAGRALFLSPFSSGAPATCPTLFLHGPLEAGSQRRKLRPAPLPPCVLYAPPRLCGRCSGSLPHPELLGMSCLSRESSSPRSLTQRRASALRLRLRSRRQGGPLRRALCWHLGAPPSCQELQGTRPGGSRSRSQHHHPAPSVVPSFHPDRATTPGGKSHVAVPAWG